jgi:hypothetical protein
MLLARLTGNHHGDRKGPEACVLYNESKFSLSLPIYRWKTMIMIASRQGMRKAKAKGCVLEYFCVGIGELRMVKESHHGINCS